MIHIFLILVVLYYGFCAMLWLVGFSLRRAFPSPGRPIPPRQAWIHLLMSQMEDKPLGRNQAVFRDQIHGNRLVRLRGARELHKARPEEPRNN